MKMTKLAPTLHRCSMKDYGATKHSSSLNRHHKSGRVSILIRGFAANRRTCHWGSERDLKLVKDKLPDWPDSGVGPYSPGIVVAPYSYRNVIPWTRHDQLSRAPEQRTASGRRSH
jgi:hypothetical protein